jgi:hypothetical protein
MAKKRKSRRSYPRRSRSKKQSGLAQVKSFVRPFAAGVGGYAITTTALNYLPMSVPESVKQFSPYVASYLLGGWKGALGAFLLTGGLSKLGSYTGGTGGFIEVK